MEEAGRAALAVYNQMASDRSPSLPSVNRHQEDAGLEFRPEADIQLFTTSQNRSDTPELDAMEFIPACLTLRPRSRGTFRGEARLAVATQRGASYICSWTHPPARTNGTFFFPRSAYVLYSCAPSPPDLLRTYLTREHQ